MLDIQQVTEQELETRVATLSAKERRVLSSPDVAADSDKICHRYGITEEEKLLIVQQLIVLVILRFVPVEVLDEEINRFLKFRDKKISALIATEIKENILKDLLSQTGNKEAARLKAGLNDLRPIPRAVIGVETEESPEIISADALPLAVPEIETLPTNTPGRPIIPTKTEMAEKTGAAEPVLLHQETESSPIEFGPDLSLGQAFQSGDADLFSGGGSTEDAAAPMARLEIGPEEEILVDSFYRKDTAKERTEDYSEFTPPASSDQRGEPAPRPSDIPMPSAAPPTTRRDFEQELKERTETASGEENLPVAPPKMEFSSVEMPLPIAIQSAPQTKTESLAPLTITEKVESGASLTRAAQLPIFIGENMPPVPTTPKPPAPPVAPILPPKDAGGGLFGKLTAKFFRNKNKKELTEADAATVPVPAWTAPPETVPMPIATDAATPPVPPKVVDYQETPTVPPAPKITTEDVSVPKYIPNE